MRLIIALLCLCLCSKLIAKDEEPPRIGNFTLPGSQQPGPLIGFGSDILDKNQSQLLIFSDLVVGSNKHSSDIVPSLLYGISDKFSASFNVPFTPNNRNDQVRSSGIEDIFLRLNYAYYSHKTTDYEQGATFVFNVFFPSGSNEKNPITGFGTESYFIGSTLSRTYVDWFMTLAGAALFIDTNNNTKFGNTYLYQGSIGKNFYTIPKKWIFAWMLELNGVYNEKNRINDSVDQNSGGNIIFMTPSLYIASKKFTLQIGAGLPITQNLFGNQTQQKYLIAVEPIFTF